jgi:hypothetical protein
MLIILEVLEELGKFKKYLLLILGLAGMYWAQLVNNWHGYMNF